jgi:hypothetical protein
LLTACTTPEQQERDLLTDRIEDRVKLPEGARRLADYARYYAFDENGLVVGVYAPGYVAPNADDACEEMLEDFTTREVPCPSETDSDRLLADQRRWVDDTDKLPLIMDGGCSVITVIYDPKAGEVKSAYCNGEA